jgi:hypothetical protein
MSGTPFIQQRGYGAAPAGYGSPPAGYGMPPVGYLEIFGYRIPRVHVPLYWAVAVVQYYHINELPDNEAREALCTLGNAVAELGGALGHEALEIVDVLMSEDEDENEGAVMPTPTAAEDLLYTSPAPTPMQCMAIEMLTRIKFMGVAWNSPEYVVMVPGPLQDALHARNPVANPRPDAPAPALEEAVAAMQM